MLYTATPTIRPSQPFRTTFEEDITVGIVLGHDGSGGRCRFESGSIGRFAGAFGSVFGSACVLIGKQTAATVAAANEAVR